MDHLRAIAPADRESELRKFLGSFGFSGERIFDPIAPFSGGEKARLVLALMIRQKPNLLLLDEPTNHLDLEMRQALSRALTEYSGAIVVISHDRHLLRSVCDELLVVHDGTVDRFNQSLDDYADWLREQQAGSGPEVSRDQQRNSNKQPGRRQQRQIEAQRRRELKPLSDQVRKVEKRLSTCRMELEKLEKKLADAELYSDTSRKEELTGLIREQAGIRSETENLEWEWLEASERLEQAKSESQA
jgi:ATP-binding cassette subfamily F protein 3